MPKSRFCSGYPENDRKRKVFVAAQIDRGKHIVGRFSHLGECEHLEADSPLRDRSPLYSDE